MRVKPPVQFLNVDHHADGVIDRRGRGVVRRSRSVSKRSRTASPLEWPTRKELSWSSGFMVSSAIHGWIAKRLPTAPTAVRNAEFRGPAGRRAVTAIENPRRQRRA